MRVGAVILIACLITALACGGGAGNSGGEGALTGNWVITLQPHGLSTAQTYTGFLIQSGSSVSGSLIMGEACNGVGSVSGSVDGTNLTLNINESAQDLSLVGTVATGSTPMSGQFSTQSAGCTTPFTSTGVWSAISIPALTGNFSGTLTSTAPGVVPVNVSGSITQGPNTGDSTAILTGTINAANPTPPFCAYLTTASITGTISGEAATLNIYGPSGFLISQIVASVTPNASSLSGSYIFQSISSSCLGDSGTLQLTLQ